MENKKDVAVGIGVGLGVGLIVGGVLGILFAPQSGKETRAEIMDRAEDFIGKVKALPADVRAKINKATVDDVKKK